MYEGSEVRGPWYSTQPERSNITSSNRSNISGVACRRPNISGVGSECAINNSETKYLEQGNHDVHACAAPI